MAPQPVQVQLDHPWHLPIFNVMSLSSSENSVQFHRMSICSWLNHLLELCHFCLTVIGQAALVHEVI